MARPAASAEPSAAGARTEGVIRIGTRGSALALIQARIVLAALAHSGVAAEIVVIETAGDRRAPDTPWGEGAFVIAIQRALLEDRVDIAIHSAKDVPTDSHPDLLIGAYLEREDPRDCLVTRVDEPLNSIADLPTGARVGTDSPRRTGFLLAQRPDLRVGPLHGNVDTRLRRLDEGQADVLVLAVAGLTRLGRADRIGAVLDASVVPPAPGQGALAVECRASDRAVRETLAAIDHAPTRTAVEAERDVLRAAGGGCRSPIGAFAHLEGAELVLTAGYASSDGLVAEVLTGRSSLPDTAVLIADLVERLETSVGIRGAGRARPRVLVTRAAGQAEDAVAALAARGMDAVVVPAIKIEAIDGAARAALRAEAETVDWVVVTSANAVEATRGVGDGSDDEAARPRSVGPRWAVIGEATGVALRATGILEAWSPSAAKGASLADELPIQAGDRVLLPRTPIADGNMAERLRERGADVIEIDAYRTLPAPPSSRLLLADALAGPGGVAAITFLSGSAVRGLLAVAGEDLAQRCSSIPAICIGPGTAKVAQELGFVSITVAHDRSIEAVAAAAASVTTPPMPRPAVPPTREQGDRR